MKHTHISRTFDGAAEWAIIEALRGTPHSQCDADIMALFRIDAQPDGSTWCVCGVTAGLIAEAVIDGKWHTGYAGYCDFCGSADYNGDTIAISSAGRFRTVQPKRTERFEGLARKSH